MNERLPEIDPCEALTVRETAALLHVSRPTVEKYVRRGELRSLLIGRCRRIRRADLEAFLASRADQGFRRYEPPKAGAADPPDDWAEGGENIPF